MDLQLKHIIEYLPHNLVMAYRISGNNFKPKGILQAVYYYRDTTHPERILLEGMDSEHIWMFKPILKNALNFQNDTDLINKIKSEFMNTDLVFGYYSDFWFGFSDGTEHHPVFDLDGEIMPNCDIFIYKLLIENLYDVNSLIKKNLALDMASMPVFIS